MSVFVGNSIRARIRSGHYYYNLVTTSFTCWLPDSKGVFFLLLWFPLVGVLFYLVCPSRFWSEWVFGISVCWCITACQPAAICSWFLLLCWVCGNTMGVMFARDAHEHDPGPARRFESICTLTSCAWLDVVEINSFLCFCLVFFLLSIWNNQTDSFCVASLPKRHSLLFFLKKQHQPL